MGEYIPASIQLGGKIKRSDTAELIGLINGHHLRTSGGLEAEAAEDNLGEEFYGSEVNYGNLEEITTFAEGVGLSYVNWHDSGSDWIERTVRYDASTGTSLEAVGHAGTGFALNEGDIKTLGSIEAIADFFAKMRAPLPPLEVIINDPEEDEDA